MTTILRRLPNALSLLRIAMLPVLGLLAWSGRAELFLGALLLSLGSDVLDGWIARRARVASPAGAKLDSWGDVATWAALPLFAWWLWPDLLRQEARTLACALFAYVAPFAVALLRFRRLTSYHTWLAKGTAVGMAAALFVLFAGGPAWPFHVATFLLVLEAAEEIAISFVLPAPRSDVRSLWHAVHRQREPRAGARRKAQGPRPGPRQESSGSRSDASSSGSSLAFTVRRSIPRRRAAAS